jgi:hypothetical protein
LILGLGSQADAACIAFMKFTLASEGLWHGTVFL